MQYREFDVEPVLSDALAAAWTLDGMDESFRGDEGPVVPDGSVEVVIPLAAGQVGLGVEDGRVMASRGRAFLVGPLTRPLALAYYGSIRLCSVRLDFRAAARLLGSDLSAIRDRAVLLDAISPALARALEPAAAEEGVHLASKRMQQVVADAVRRSSTLDARFDGALAAVLSTKGRIGVAAMAKKAALSARQLDRTFDRSLGLTPKLLCGIIRFRSAWELAARGACRNWAEVAARCGYADQSHLIRDFRRFAGGPPTVAMPAPDREGS